MTIPAIHDGDTLSILVTVEESAVAKDLTGATVATSAKGAGSSNTIAGTATLSNAAGGEVLVEYGAGDLSVGTWNVQLRVTLSGDIQTVYDDDVTVQTSAL